MVKKSSTELHDFSPGEEDEELDTSEQTMPRNVAELKKRQARLEKLKDATLYTYVYRFDNEAGTKRTSVGRLEGADVDDFEIGTKFGGPATYLCAIKWTYDEEPPAGIARKGVVSSLLFRIGAEYGSPESKAPRPGIAGMAAIPGSTSLAGLNDMSIMIQMFKEFGNIVRDMKDSQPAAPAFDATEMIKSITKTAHAFVSSSQKLIPSNDSPGAPGADSPGAPDLGLNLNDLVGPLLKEYAGPLLKDLLAGLLKGKAA